MAFRIPLNESTLGPAEIAAAKAVLDGGQLTMAGRVRAFEAEFAAYLGASHAVMVNSGSSANLLALSVLANPLLDGAKRIAPDGEVIVPALGWSTTVWPVIQVGAVPVFVDCDPQTLQVRVEDIAAAVTERTCGIVLVHVLGGAVEIDAVLDLARRHGLWVVEDTCEGLGVRFDGRYIGTFGDIGTYSFYFSHHITTIEGGMLVTNDDRVADLARAMRAHGWVRHMQHPERYVAADTDIDPRYLFVTTGFNLRPTEINAALGSEQLKRLAGFNERRRAVNARLLAALAPQIERGDLTPMRVSQRIEAAPFGQTVLCRTHEIRNALRDHLEENGIETRPIICGNMARQPALGHLRHRVSGSLAGADKVMDCGLYWGTHPMMTDDQVDYIVSVVQRFFP